MGGVGHGPPTVRVYRGFYGFCAPEPGGAIFEIGRGSLDASVDTQLGEIERGLVDRLGDRP